MSAEEFSQEMRRMKRQITWLASAVIVANIILILVTIWKH